MDEDDDQGPNLSAAFPDPPPFYRYFTAENIEKLEAARNQAVPLDTIPAELKTLIPPQAPSSGEYRVFGQTFKIEESLPSLKDQGVEQLFPDNATSKHLTSMDPSSGPSLLPQQLKQLLRSILLSFLELVTILSTNPQEFGPKIDDLNTLFYNMLHLINEYRPHQARETLIDMMEAQLRQKRAEIEGVRGMQVKVDKLLDSLTARTDVMENEEQSSPVDGDTEPWRNKEQDNCTIWSTLDALEA